MRYFSVTAKCWALHRSRFYKAHLRLEFQIPFEQNFGQFFTIFFECFGKLKFIRSVKYIRIRLFWLIGNWDG